MPLIARESAKDSKGKGKAIDIKQKQMSPEETLDWYRKLLDGARGNRYRKLQRYGRYLNFSYQA